MSPADRLRLFVLCFCLLACDVNCEIPQRGYVLRVEPGHTPTGVRNDDRGYERWSDPPVFRIPTAGYKTSSVERGQSGNIHPAQEDRTIDSESSQIQSQYPLPERKVNHLKSGLNLGSITRGHSAVVYDCPRNKEATVPDGKRIHQAGSDSVFATGPVQSPPHIYHARTKPRESFSPVQADKAPAGVGPHNRKGLISSHSSTGSPDIQDIKSSLKSESHKIHMNSRYRPNIHPPHQKSRLATRPEGSGYHSLPKVLKPIDKRTDSIVKGLSHGSGAAGKVKPQMPHLAWGPRAYGSDVTYEARGYAHARRLKPGSDKTRPQASSAAGRKFLETGFPSENQNQGIYSHDSTKLEFGFSVSTSSDRELNPNHKFRGSKAQIPVQGKFKPFQRIPTNNDLSADTKSSDSETASGQTFPGTTLPPSLNSTGLTSTVVPSASGHLSTNSSSPMQTEGEP